ncbi:ABC transporter, ATP-binding protein [Bacillus sp. JCM 19046]|nr:ABC transporter, ATP-binding protein [Bacillus sp. JCM 19046]
MAFRDEDVHKKIAVLSGGERVRTALAIVFLGHFNVLILDEPTNYLDLTTKESLMDVLKAYPGTVIFVTHDRALIKDVATHQLSFYDEMPVIRELAESK